MKALVMTEYRAFACQDVPMPEIGAREVLIKVMACGICGSDVHGMDGSTGRRRPPVIMGHEAAGVIARTGRDVTAWQVGDRVTFDSTVYCGECGFCRAGRINLCDNRRVLGVSCAEYRRDGAFAEYVAVPQHILYRLPEQVSYDQAAMVEALSIAVHAVERTHIAIGDHVAVVGAGMIGLLLIQVLRQRGCGRILALDIEPDKLAKASGLGADEVYDAKAPDLAALIGAATGGGVAVVFDAVGIAASVNTGLSILRKGGTMTLVGNLAAKIDFPLQAVVTREIRLNGSCASAGEYPACLELIASGRIDVKALISATDRLANGAAWFDRLYAKEPGLTKVILHPND